MKKYITVLLPVLLLVACVTQKETIMKPKETLNLEHEVFDFEKYKDKSDRYNAFNYKFEEEDGTIVWISSATSANSSGEINIHYFYPQPYFYIDYKCFYANGKLKAKGRFGLQAWPIGKWLECDEEGNCKIMDYDEDRGNFTYEDVLRFMEKQKHINLKTGEGKDEMSVIYNYEQQVWSVGTSRGYIVSRDYILDGNTGKVLKDEVLPFVP